MQFENKAVNFGHCDSDSLNADSMGSEMVDTKCVLRPFNCAGSPRSVERALRSAGVVPCQNVAMLGLRFPRSGNLGTGPRTNRKIDVQCYANLMISKT